jgi:hypothetical protein
MHQKIKFENSGEKAAFGTFKEKLTKVPVRGPPGLGR